MKKLIFLGILVLIASFAIGCDNEEQKPQKRIGEFEPFSFAVITDLHIGRDIHDSGPQDYGAPGFADYDLETGQAREENEGGFNIRTDRLVATVDWLNANHRKGNIKFLVILGDITDTAEMSEFFRAKKILDNLAIPYIPLMGNHDVWSHVGELSDNPWEKEEKEGKIVKIGCQHITETAGEKYFEKILWNETYNKRNIERIKNLFGPSWLRQEEQEGFAGPPYLQNYAFSYQSINFLGLDYNYRKSNCKASFTYIFSATKEKWLKQNLEKHKGEIVLVFSHHPYVEAGGFLPLEVDDFVKIVYRNSPNGPQVLNFGGHVHPSPSLIGNQNITLKAVLLSSAGPGQFPVPLGPGVPVIVTKALTEKDPDFLRIVRVKGPRIEDIDYSNEPLKSLDSGGIVTIEIGELIPTITPTLTPIVSCPPEGESKFDLGQEVITTDALKVRTEPRISPETEIKTQPKGTSGKILEGPICAYDYVWWKVEYQDGTIGWSAENWLEKAPRVIKTPTPVVETPTLTPETPTFTPTITPTLIPETQTPVPETPTPVPFGKCGGEIREKVTRWASENACRLSISDSWFAKAFCAFWSPAEFTLYSFFDCDSIGENVWVVGRYSLGGYGIIVHSPDSGKSWEVQWTNSEIFGPDPFAIDFLDKNRGFLATNDNILQTLDGGKTWQEIFRVKSYPGLKDWGVWLREFQVIDQLHLWGRLSEGIVVKTEDGGITWFYSEDEGQTWQSYPQ